MTVEEAIATDDGTSPKDGVVGKAWPDWCDVGTVAVQSGRLTAVDFGVMSASSGVSVEMPCGAYLVQARIMSFGGSLGICAARAVRQSIRTGVRGAEVGKVSVDVARITIADIADAAAGLDRDDLRSISGQTREIWKLHGAMVDLKFKTKAIHLPCIRSGFGDGTYPAYALTNSGATVGLEVEFVGDGHVFRDTSMTPAEFLQRYDEMKKTGKWRGPGE